VQTYAAVSGVARAGASGGTRPGTHQHTFTVMEIYLRFYGGRLFFPAGLGASTPSPPQTSALLLPPTITTLSEFTSSAKMPFIIPQKELNNFRNFSVFASYTLLHLFFSSNCNFC